MTMFHKSSVYDTHYYKSLNKYIRKRQTRVQAEITSFHFDPNTQLLFHLHSSDSSTCSPVSGTPDLAFLYVVNNVLKLESYLTYCMACKLQQWICAIYPSRDKCSKSKIFKQLLIKQDMQ
jgi:hypothetical protein